MAPGKRAPAGRAGATKRREPRDGDPLPRIRRDLLAWYDRHRRDLPWRRTRDPYAVWVSEVMLQQTRVEAAIPYFERFLRRFPGFESLAAASEEEVLSLWSGLGYYRRARALWEAARVVVREHSGGFPRDLEAAIALPGVGRYTAGAVLSIAYGLAHPVLDGNVARVLARFFRVGDPSPETRLWGIAGRLVPGPRPGDLNQALMELGARVCRPAAPSCGACPLRGGCSAFVEGCPQRYPARRPRPAAVRVGAAAALVRRRGRILLWRVRGRGSLAGMWELPGGEHPAREEPAAVLERESRRLLGVPVRAAGEVLLRLRHSIMNRRIAVTVLRGRVEGRLPRRGPGADCRWVLPRGIEAYPITGTTRKILERLPSPDRGIGRGKGEKGSGAGEEI